MWNVLSKMGVGMLLLVATATVHANPFDQLKAGMHRTAEFNPPPENKFLPGKPRTRVGEKRAASQAKSAFPDSKILSVNYMQGNNSYRVKLLSRGGVVKYVYVNPRGEVFE